LFPGLIINVAINYGRSISMMDNIVEGRGKQVFLSFKFRLGLCFARAQNICARNY